MCAPGVAGWRLCAHTLHRASRTACLATNFRRDRLRPLEPKPGGQVLAANCGVLLCATQTKAPLCLCHKMFGAENDRFRPATQMKTPLCLCRQRFGAENDRFRPATQTRQINRLCRTDKMRFPKKQDENRCPCCMASNVRLRAESMDNAAQSPIEPAELRQM